MRVPATSPVVGNTGSRSCLLRGHNSLRSARSNALARSLPHLQDLKVGSGLVDLHPLLP
jgi:hypothetical protein